jgi:hypothetical protein
MMNAPMWSRDSSLTGAPATRVIEWEDAASMRGARRGSSGESAKAGASAIS